VFAAEGEVVCVYEGGDGGAAEDADGEGDEH
jgi:hypothetical protein